MGKSLFILGNGFDIMHKLPTKYADFREYLKKTYTITKHDEYAVPTVLINNAGEPFALDFEVADFWFNLFDDDIDMGENWSSFEDGLGKIIYPDDCFIDSVTDRDGESNILKTANVNSDISRDIFMIAKSVGKFFSEWIKSVDINAERCSEFADLLSEDDWVFSFNYTETMEKLYGHNKICHIHGVVGEELLFGHGRDGRYDDKYHKYLGSEDYLPLVDELFKKNTAKALKEHYAFFEALQNDDIREVYSIGFSYSDVDMIYIQTIIKCLSGKKVTWYCHDYKGDAYAHIAKVKECGFSGECTVFSLGQ